MATHIKQIQAATTATGRKSPLTELQQKALANVVDNPLDVKQAFLDAGYDTKSVHAAIRALKDEIIELAEMQLVTDAAAATHTIRKIMLAEEAIPMASQKLDASKTVLDRIGLGKKQEMDVNHNVSGGLFILPAKVKGEVIEGDFEEA